MSTTFAHEWNIVIDKSIGGNFYGNLNNIYNIIKLNIDKTDVNDGWRIAITSLYKASSDIFFYYHCHWYFVFLLVYVL